MGGRGGGGRDKMTQTMQFHILNVKVKQNFITLYKYYLF
jgi:hypothetical protein